MEWWAYVKEVAGDDSTHEISRQMGGKPTASAVGRWKDVPPKAESAVAFARAYHQSPTAALVAAGLLKAGEATGAIADMDEEALLVELLRRARERKAQGG